MNTLTPEQEGVMELLKKLRSMTKIEVEGLIAVCEERMNGKDMTVVSQRLFWKKARAEACKNLKTRTVALAKYGVAK